MIRRTRLQVGAAIASLLLVGTAVAIALTLSSAFALRDHSTEPPAPAVAGTGTIASSWSIEPVDTLPGPLFVAELE